METDKRFNADPDAHRNPPVQSRRPSFLLPGWNDGRCFNDLPHHENCCSGGLDNPIKSVIMKNGLLPYQMRTGSLGEVIAHDNLLNLRNPTSDS